MKITLNRFLIFASFILLVGLMLQQCWQRKSDAEKWLYLFEEPAREYAGRVLGPDRGTGLPPPESLSDMQVEVREAEGYVVYSSGLFTGIGKPPLHIAFAPNGPPPEPEDRAAEWIPVRDSWYRLHQAP